MTITEDDWVELRRFAQLAAANQSALVLTARGIGCRLQPAGGGIALYVPRADVVAAHAELTAFVRENRKASRPPPPPTRPIGEGVGAALVYVVVLLLVQGAANVDFLTPDWFAAGSAQAGRIQDGEAWRVLTALSLHVDVGHLMSNVVAGAVFGAFLAQSLGGGLTFLTALIAGGVGNLVNALMHGPAHDAVGASTAVFAILGILTALAWRREVLFSRRGMARAILPLAAGATLLAMFGVGGERTDIGAHLWGFAAGGGAGIVLYPALRVLPMGMRAQWTYGAAALALLALAWVVALAVW